MSAGEFLPPDNTDLVPGAHDLAGPNGPDFCVRPAHMGIGREHQPHLIGSWLLKNGFLGRFDPEWNGLVERYAGLVGCRPD